MAVCRRVGSAAKPMMARHSYYVSRLDQCVFYSCGILVALCIVVERIVVDVLVARSTRGRSSPITTSNRRPYNDQPPQNTLNGSRGHNKTQLVAAYRTWAFACLMQSPKDSSMSRAITILCAAKELCTLFMALHTECTLRCIPTKYAQKNPSTLCFNLAVLLSVPVIA